MRLIDCFGEDLKKLEPSRIWIATILMPPLLALIGLKARQRKEADAEDAALLASATTMLRETREQLVCTQARLEACLHQLDKLRSDGWKMQDALTELHAAATAARMRVHQLEAFEGRDLTVFAPLPVVLL